MIDIKNTFVKLTSKRYPRGKEDQVIELLPEYKFEKDEIGNYFIIVKKQDDTFSDTMFTCHLDTIDRTKFTTTDWSNRKWNVTTGKWDIIDPEKEKNVKVDDGSVIHVFEDDFIKTDGNTNLGADDKAGMTIMLNMISENIPGLYYFFIGEETGCIGSSGISRKFTDLIKEQKLPDVKKCISFDRRSYGSVITHQMSSRCCSDEFGNELSKRLNEFGFWYANDSTGIYTDSAEFLDIIPECTNLSVGYFDEHSLTEKQDIEFLELLSRAVLKIDWDSLPITRTIDDCKYTGKKSKTYTTYNGYNYGNEWMNDEDEYLSRYYHNNNFNSSTNTTSTTSTTNNSSSNNLKKEIDDFDFDKWYNEQKAKSIILND